MSTWENNEEIQIFREYLQIPSVHPNIDYEPCVNFLKRQAKSLDLPISVCYPATVKCPVVIITWEGLQPNLPSIMLSSHMDVVPADEARWTYPPFGAEMDEDGNIYARGTQDIKYDGTLYLATIRALMKEGVRLRRTIHVTFVPEEEVGIEFGMKAFVKSEEFKALNVGFEIDESCAHPLADTVLVLYVERIRQTVEIICEGTSGHSSILHGNTAAEKLHYMTGKLLQFREDEKRRLKANPHLKSGDVTSVNLTVSKGGQQMNTVPAEFSAIFDIRLSVELDIDKFDEQMKQWCKEAGEGINLKYHLKEPKTPATKCDSSNPFWVAFERSMEKLGMIIDLRVCDGSTDARFIREANIPALGITPMPKTPIMLHGHDEYVNAEVYLNGIHFYKEVVSNLANVADIK